MKHLTRDLENIDAPGCFMKHKDTSPSADMVRLGVKVKVQVQVEPKKYFFKNLCKEPPFRILAPPPLIVNYFVKSPLFYFNTIIMIQ